MSVMIRALCDLLACLRFWSRLPVPVLAFETDPHAMPDFSRAVAVLPFAALVIALPGVVALGLGAGLGLPPGATAGLVLAALVLATGAFHEDGLADTADGFGGGATRERKLEIMKDSRLGSYGAIAMILAQGLRWTCLATLVAQNPARAALAVLGAAAVSRVAGLVPLALLPPARKDGAAYAAQRPTAGTFWRAAGLAFLCGLLPALAGGGAHRLLLACGAALVAGFALAEISRRQIGGQTGDVAGAAQQIGEIAYLLLLVVA